MYQYIPIHMYTYTLVYMRNSHLYQITCTHTQDIYIHISINKIAIYVHTR